MFVRYADGIPTCHLFSTQVPAWSPMVKVWRLHLLRTLPETFKNVIKLSHAKCPEFFELMNVAIAMVSSITPEDNLDETMLNSNDAGLHDAGLHDADLRCRAALTTHLAE